MSEAPPLHWEVVKAQVSAELATKTSALETVTPDRLHRLQGEIAMLRWVLKLPETIESARQRKLQSGEPTY